VRLFVCLEGVNFLWGLLPANEMTLRAWARRFQVSARNSVALLSASARPS